MKAKNSVMCWLGGLYCVSAHESLLLKQGAVSASIPLRSMNTRDPLELNAAKELLIKQKKDGIVKAYQVDETKDKMVAGEAALALVWSGDAQYAIDLNPDLAYAVPDEGSNIWVDGMGISSPHNPSGYPLPS